MDNGLESRILYSAIGIVAAIAYLQGLMLEIGFIWEYLIRQIVLALVYLVGLNLE